MLRDATSRDRWFVLSLCLFPILAKLHLLLGLLKADPLLFYAGLTPRNGPGWLNGYPTIDPNIAATSQALGGGAVKSVLSGALPWWNHFQGVGAPLLGEMQSAALFPPTLLLALPNGQLYMHLLLQVIAGAATYFLLRRLACPRSTALVGGLLFEFNGTYAWMATASINPVCFLPLLLLGIEVARDRSGRWGGWGWIALALALSLYAGFPEVAYYNALMAGVWILARLPGLPRPEAWRFLGRVTLGVASGLMLAAPVIIAFFDFLDDAFVGQHTGGFTAFSLPPSAFIKVFVPYLHGLIYEQPVTAAGFWNDVGGYAGILPVALSLYALAGMTRRLAPLRLALGLWVAVTVAACYGVPGVAKALAVVPGFALTAFYRYLPCTWEFALCVLSGLALADLAAGYRDALDARRSVRAFWIASAALAGLLLAAFALPQPASVAEIVTPWRARSLAFAVILLVGWFWCRPRMKTDAAPRVLAVLAVVEAVVFFVIPTMAYHRKAQLEPAGIRFLRDNLGFQRFYTLGPIEPNYGTYFQIGEVNHDDMPVPARWVDHVAHHLDDNATASVFAHNRLRPDGPSPVENFLKNQANYQAVGVKYLVTAPDTDPYARHYADIAAGPNTPLVLQSGQRAGLTLKDPGLGGTLSGLALPVGTYGDRSDGVLSATVCSQGRCSIGSAALGGAADNHPFTIILDDPLPLGTDLTVELDYDDANTPLVLWMWPRAANARTSISHEGREIADQTFRFQLDLADHPPLVFQDRAMRLYELPAPRPYLDAAGCQLFPRSRDSFDSDCPVPTTLTRLELAMAGWRVTINGQEQPVAMVADLFQQITLPAGQASVSFRFLPPYMPLGYGLFAIGCALLVLTVGNPLAARRVLAGMPLGGRSPIGQPALDGAMMPTAE
ncbi:MAG: hypothetical protein PW843_18425 [Azospirillaceae bacterium]|nr:hypothetical protein [Azospirillaceae bacterium]